MNRLSIAALAAALAIAVFASRASAQFIYVANAGEDTVSKIDVGTNMEVARYATWFNAGTNSLIAPHLNNAWAGPAPSRIAVDAAGMVYVLNRFFSTGTGATAHTWSNPPHRPVLFKINPSGGTPTSTGPTPLSITDSNNNYEIEPGEITDQAILWAKSIGQASDNIGVGRAVAVDTAGKLWVGMYSTKKYYQVDAATGNMIPPNSTGVSTGSHTPYGCAVDVNGHLWSVDEQNTLAEIDTNTPALLGTYTHAGYNYALAISNDCTSSPPKVKVYLSDRSGHTFITFDAQTHTVVNYPPAGIPQFASYAIAADSQGNIISGAVAGGQIIKVSPSGTLMWSVGPFPNTSTQYSQNLHGMIIDKNDHIWAVDLYGNAGSAPNGRVLHYSPSGAFIQAVTVGNRPYTYGNAPPPTCAGSPSPTPTPTPLISPTPTPTPTPSGCAEVSGEAHCLPDGSYSYTFTVKNNSGNPASQILLTPVQGSTFTLTPQLTNLSSPLQNGQSASITTTIGNASPGDKVCFFVSLMSEKTQCCIVEVCLTMPECGQVSPIPAVTSSLTPVPRQPSRGRRRP